MHSLAHSARIKQCRWSKQRNKFDAHLHRWTACTAIPVERSTGLFEVYRVHVTVFLLHVTCEFGEFGKIRKV